MFRENKRVSVQISVMFNDITKALKHESTQNKHEVRRTKQKTCGMAKKNKIRAKPLPKIPCLGLNHNGRGM